jgi:hypothetical protein
MDKSTIKSDFHRLIDRIDNEELLSAFYQLLEKRSEQQTGKLWDSLTEEEKSELLLSYDESQDESNWISEDVIKKKHEQWLKK